jgi:hypothetical protein
LPSLSESEPARGAETELRREELYAAYAEASQDGAFMDEARSTTDAFDVTARDGLE